MRGSRHFYERGSNRNGKILSQTRGVQPPIDPKITFLGKFFRFQRGVVRTPPPSGSAHDLDPFYGKVNCGNRGFYMGKSENY